jgi:hypothetical protein
MFWIEKTSIFSIFMHNSEPAKIPWLLKNLFASFIGVAPGPWIIDTKPSGR